MRVQRIRVGLTGLGAVLLVVAATAAIFDTARRDAQAGATAVAPSAAVSPAIENAAEPANEPLAEIGVTPMTVDPEKAEAAANDNAKAVPPGAPAAN